MAGTASSSSGARTASSSGMHTPTDAPAEVLRRSVLLGPGHPVTIDRSERPVVRNGVESEGLRSLKSFVPLKQNQSEVLILSYEIFRLHVNVIKEANKVGILVVDEGHRLKNTSGSQILTALNSVSVESRILISGTPIQVRILAHPPTPVSLESTH